MRDEHHTSPTSFVAFDHFDQSHANRLLGVGLGGPPRPVDELIDHLNSGASPTWLETALDQGPAKELGSARMLLLDGQATLEQMTAVKNQSKRLLKKASTSQERLAAMAGYFISIAASVAHHGVVPSNRPYADIRDVLIDLAIALPEPWNEMLGQATIGIEERILSGETGGEQSSIQE